MSTIIMLVATLLLLGMSAMFSGLTLGLLSLNLYELKRKTELGDSEAELVYPIRARGNELLVTLIVGNVLVNAALTVLLDSLLPGGSFVSSTITVIIATVLITIFGEILPQAALKKHGMRFAARTSPYITFLLDCMRPISQPLGRFLDRTIGREVPTVYSTAELVKILEEHEEAKDSDVEADEVAIVKRALSFGDMQVKEIMTPRSMIAAIEADETFTLDTIARLQETGHSRFPVYEGDMNKMVGLLYLRDLIAKEQHTLTARQAADKTVNYVNEEQLLDHVLNAFIKTKRHLFVVVNKFEEVVGVITMEDIIEEIIGKEIVDEFDKFDDLREVAALRAKKAGHKKPANR